MNVLLMIIAFLMLTGIALLFYNLADMNIMESMFMAAASVIILLHISATLNILFVGMLFLRLLALAGIVVVIVLYYFGESEQIKDLKGTFIDKMPAYIALAGIFIVSIVLYKGDFIQHYDELHLWALVPKHMMQYGRLPVGDSLVTSSDHAFGTSFFHYFFQKNAGYNEGMMYVSNALLYWIGFLLPFGACEKKDRGRILLYILIIYLALYSIYPYGTKNMYVDIPVAAWTCGLMAWISQNIRTKKRKQLMIILPALFVIYDFKKSIGWLLDAFILLFLLLMYLINTEEELEEGVHLSAIILAGVNAVYTLGIGLAFLVLTTESLYTFLPKGLSSTLLTNEVSREKVFLTLDSYINNVIAESITKTSIFFNISLLFLLVICFAVLLISEYPAHYTFRSKMGIGYCLTMVYIFLTATFFGFIFKFDFESSVNTKACLRYISIMGMIMLGLALFRLLYSRERLSTKQFYASVMLLILFISGIDSRFLSNSTSWYPEKVAGYYEMREIRREAESVRKIMNSGKKVYFINQTEEYEEYAVNEAFFEMYPYINDFREKPWQFSVTGCTVGSRYFYTLAVDSLPFILKNGEYSYLWIYNVDEYLKDNLVKEFEFTEDVSFMKGQLFKVSKGKEKLLKLTLVKNLVPFDDRELYESAQ